MASSKHISTPGAELVYSKDIELVQGLKTKNISPGVLSAEELAEVAVFFKLLANWRDEAKNFTNDIIERQSVEGQDV